MRSRKVPESQCLSCGVTMDAASVWGSEAHTPSPGDITLCAYCGYIMAFDDEMRLRDLTSEEFDWIAKNDMVIRMQREVRANPLRRKRRS